LRVIIVEKGEGCGVWGVGCGVWGVGSFLSELITDN